jgi:hypothetical protein
MTTRWNHSLESSRNSSKKASRLISDAFLIFDRSGSVRSVLRALSFVRSRYFRALSRLNSRIGKSGSESIAFSTSFANSSTTACHSIVPTGKSPGHFFPCAFRIAPTLRLNARALRKVGSFESAGGLISWSIDGLSAAGGKTLGRIWRKYLRAGRRRNMSVHKQNTGGRAQNGDITCNDSNPLIAPLRAQQISCFEKARRFADIR